MNSWAWRQRLQVGCRVLVVAVSGELELGRSGSYGVIDNVGLVDHFRCPHARARGRAAWAPPRQFLFRGSGRAGARAVRELRGHRQRWPNYAALRLIPWRVVAEEANRKFGQCQIQFRQLRLKPRCRFRRDHARARPPYLVSVTPHRGCRVKAPGSRPAFPRPAAAGDQSKRLSARGAPPAPHGAARRRSCGATDFRPGVNI